ncbi:acyl-CoA thioesterase [Jiella mangrovi]|uniref:Acyl-CoA thioesterase n=1 Tax=Jiella mangrovi TaxID=2821407 RepID=A0ABS4BEE4_9HYPH|nr:acyl-CoA thioesterase [Jiella mangrovi]MBP0614541.1 acyl-CoA thioesterase [Jiella mangrovi]
MADEASVFTARYALRFGQCDPAGIAFFPRLVEMLAWTVEDWFAEALGQSFRRIHVEEDRATPVVSLSVDFVSPARLGDVLVHELRVLEIGRSAVKLDICVAKEDGTMVLRSTQTVVHCALSGEAPQSQALPEGLRRKMEGYLVRDAQVA